MAQPNNRKNDAHRAQRRRQLIAALYCEGRSQTEIARQLGISQPAVSQHLAAVREEWLAATQRDYGDRVAEELARLSHLEATAWAAYQRSCEPPPAPGRTGGKHGGRAPGPHRDKPATGPRGAATPTPSHLARPGDPRFLDQIFRCREARLKVLGLLRGQQVNVSTVVGRVDWDKLLDWTTPPGPDPIEAEIAAIEAEVEARAAPQLPGPSGYGTNGTCHGGGEP
jgi:DNA-binding transcriptional ArsR family regulator